MATAKIVQTTRKETLEVDVDVKEVHLQLTYEQAQLVLTLLGSCGSDVYIAFGVTEGLGDRPYSALLKAGVNHTGVRFNTISLQCTGD